MPPAAISNSSASTRLEKASDLLQKRASKQKDSSHVPMEHIVSVKNTVVGATDVEVRIVVYFVASSLHAKHTEDRNKGMLSLVSLLIIC